MKLTNYLVIVVQLLVLTFASPVLAKSPQQPVIQSILDDAYHKFKNENSGKNADYIPALAKVDSVYFKSIHLSISNGTKRSTSNC